MFFVWFDLFDLLYIGRGKRELLSDNLIVIFVDGRRFLFFFENCIVWLLFIEEMMSYVLKLLGI